MPVSPARTIAFEILRLVESEGAYAADALHARLTPSAKRPATAGGPVKRQDAALATELVFGVLRWQRLLDFLIERQAKRSAERLDADVRRALRVGAYQLLFLDRVPASAAVNESVELAKVAGKERAAGLVNAVLRRMPRGPFRAADFERTLPIGLGEAARLGILYSHPEWMVARWLGAFGRERTRALLEANNRPLPVACRVLPPLFFQPESAHTGMPVPPKPGAPAGYSEQVAESLREDGLVVEKGRLLASALMLRGGSASETAAFREGWIAVQDEASQAVALLAGVEKGQSVLDLCAAPGNKTLQLARAAGPGARVVAADLHVHRLRAVRWQMQRTGTENVGLVALDGTKALPFSQRFDRILVDAPCSGTGTLARNPEIRWRLRAEDIADLAARQAAILRNGLDALAPGGRLVYATCSLEREENEGVVRRVLGERSDVRAVGAGGALAGELAEGVSAERLFDEEGFFRTMPAETGTDGFFAAVIERI